MEFQQTLKKEINLTGIGLHTGQTVNLKILPAPENHGYKFQRVDIENQPIIEADADLVVSTERGTTLEKNGARVYTTEHLLASLYGMQIDNALIQLDAPEVPIMDGSALMFIKAIEETGTVQQNAIREYFEFTENIPFEIEGTNIEILAVPDTVYRLTVMVDYNSQVLGTQHATMYNIGEFKDEIAPCRTFVFLRELEHLAKNGLIKGGDLDNAIVLVERENVPQEELDNLAELLGKKDLKVSVKGIGVLNSSDLKFINEPARHKLLDIIGDLALVGKPIKGHILAACPGHMGNVAFAKVIKGIIKKQRKQGPKVDIQKEPLYDIHDIEKILPHKYPFLLVDKILEMDDTSILGLKNISINEPYFQGHFPSNPVVPGVLQMESMAQVGGILALSKVDNPEEYSTYFLKMDNVKFKKKVLPGDALVVHMVMTEPIRRGIVQMRGTAYVNNQVVSEADLVAQIVKDNARKN